MIQNDETIPYNVLLVESNSFYANDVKKNLENKNIHHCFFNVTHTSEAIDFLVQRKKYAKTPKPDIIFLDFNHLIMEGI